MNKWGKKGEVYLFDRDPEYFSTILGYLRTGKLVYDKGVWHELAALKADGKISLEGIKEEAKFFELHALEREIRKAIYAKNLETSRSKRIQE